MGISRNSPPPQPADMVLISEGSYDTVAGAAAWVNAGSFVVPAIGRGTLHLDIEVVQLTGAAIAAEGGFSGTSAIQPADAICRATADLWNWYRMKQGNDGYTRIEKITNAASWGTDTPTFTFATGDTVYINVKKQDVGRTYRIRWFCWAVYDGAGG